MINYWWVTRPKRKLHSIPEVLTLTLSIIEKKEWEGNRDLHLLYEEELEKSRLKKEGDRRDQGGGGARTYLAWLKSLGLLFKQNKTNKVFLTLAGEAIISGEKPFEVISNQVLKYQFPSAYSVSRGVNVSSSFRIHPFWFLLKLLSDNRLNYLTQEEIGKIVITYAENETDSCYNAVVEKIIRFRELKDKSLPDNFNERFKQSKGGRSEDEFGHLLDTANTFINWLEYTRLIVRGDGFISISPEKKNIVSLIISHPLPFIERPENEEFFQRKYGLAPGQKKDTRYLNESNVITDTFVYKNLILKAFFSETLIRPINRIDNALIDSISNKTGIDPLKVENVLQNHFSNTKLGTLDLFLTNFRDMAFSSTEKATEFEKATVSVFSEIFGFETKHVGPIGLTPDVLLKSNSNLFAGIIDNKAYSRYSITNDHHNRMVYNYIKQFNNYSDGCPYPLTFFSYVAGGFIPKIKTELESIIEESHISGSAIKIDNLILLIKRFNEKPIPHSKLQRLFSIGKEITPTDIFNVYE